MHRTISWASSSAGCLPWPTARYRLGAVCQPWHTFERRLPRPKQLPWLALSLPSSRTADRAAFFSLSDKAVYKLPFPAGGSPRARLCGSADDWLIVAHGEQGNFLYNPFTGARLPLPHQCNITRSSYLDRVSLERVQYFPDPRNESEPYIRKVVLSCEPSVDEPGKCVITAIIDSGELFFCRLGQNSWRRPRMRDGSSFHDRVGDILFFNGRLYAMSMRFLHDDTAMQVFAVHEDADELVESSQGGGGILKKLPDYIPDVSWQLERGYVRRYFVESSGQLLVVERYYRYVRDDARRTYLLKVLHRTPTMAVPYGSPIEQWMPLESLDGEVLFLGGSGSRSFAASEFGGDDDADCIYFTDDQPEEEWRRSKFTGDDWLWLGNWIRNKREGQPCRDIGRFCMRSKSVRFLNSLPFNERRSPPTWLYLSDRRS